MNILETLVSGMFFEDLWGKKAVLLKQCESFFQGKIDVLEIVRNNTIYYPELRFFGNNGSESPLLYTESNRHHLSERISATKFLDVVNMTGTIKIKSAERYDKKLNELKKYFENFFPESMVSMNLYASKGPCYGATPHYDSYHIFAVQLDGSKTWNLGKIITYNPHEDFIYKGTIENNFTDSLVTHPGDILYIPPGLFHQVYTQEHSAHVTVGIHTKRIYQHIHEAVLKAASKYKELRSDIPMTISRSGARYDNINDSILDAVLKIISIEASYHDK